MELAGKPIGGADENPASVVSNADTFSNDPAEDFWSATNIAGKALHIMRLPIADNSALNAEGQLKNNGSFTEVDAW